MKETAFMSEIDDYHDGQTPLSCSAYKTWLTENCSNSGCAFQLCVVKVFFQSVFFSTLKKRAEFRQIEKIDYAV